jgi:DNA ligase 1
MIFHTVAEAFLSLGKESSRTKMTVELAQLFGAATAHEAQLLSYLALGTLRAPYQGNQFNFAEKSMIKLLAHIAGDSVADYTAFVKKVGDCGTAILEREWPYHDKHLTVIEVHNRLEMLMALSGTGSQEEKAAYLLDLLGEVDALCASFIVRIILGTMRLGFSDMTLIDAFSWMYASDKSLKTPLENAYNVCADIGLIVHELKSKGIEYVSHMEPTIGIPIRPAAAERAESPQAIIDRLGPCVAQPKLDGFRLQVHLDKSHKEPRVWFYSRNLIDMSPMFPDLLKAVVQIDAESLIVEGEAIVYDETTGTFLPFQETVKRKRKHDIEEVAESLPLRLFLFDVLYVNGKSVMPLGHEERRALLLKYCGNLKTGVVKVIEERHCTTAEELGAYFNQEISSGLEGLVVKRPDARYQPGKRNFNWIKLKRHEVGQLTDTIDAVVLGYYAGRGKRASFGIGAFLVGVYNPENDTFETVAKIGTGLSDEEWVDLKKRCDQQVAESQLHNVVCAPELAPDVWVAPTIVVVVRADEITQSPLHTAGRTKTHLGFALRFPRFMGYSLDKSPTQATSVHELKELYRLQFSKK